MQNTTGLFLEASIIGKGRRSRKMTVPQFILYNLAKVWPDYMRARREQLGGHSIDRNYHISYAILRQYDGKVRSGFRYDFRDKKVLEIGCGHGGIALFLAINGAERVVGIDLNSDNLEIANEVRQKFAMKMGASKDLPVEFREMDAHRLCFDPEFFDIILADNVFEHVAEPEKVMQESYRVLKLGGRLIVPTFSSIWSRNALHLKHSIKVPWANLFFSEETVIDVVKRLCDDKPELVPMYPGVLENPKRVRDLRKYKDLNDITYPKFRSMAHEAGFTVEHFATRPSPKWIGRLVAKIPIIKNSMLRDIFSVGAEAVLHKDGSEFEPTLANK